MASYPILKSGRCRVAIRYTRLAKTRRSTLSNCINNTDINETVSENAMSKVSLGNSRAGNGVFHENILAFSIIVVILFVSVYEYFAGLAREE